MQSAVANGNSCSIARALQVTCMQATYKKGETMKTLRMPALLALLAAGFASTPLQAQDAFPSRVVRLVLGNPPGATSDVLAREMLPKLSAQLNNATLIVDNKIGANANIAVEFVARQSKPDGYTLMLNTANVVLSRAMGEKLPYDLFTDLMPVALLASGPQWLVAHESLPAANPAQFVAQLKANPGKLSYGSAGNGNIMHLAALVVLQANGATALHVPYKGGGLAMLDLLAGRIQFSMPDTTLVKPLSKDKRARVLAITSLKRSALLPDVPTLAETIMPGLEVTNWFGVLAPAGTPAPIVRRLNTEMSRLMQDGELKNRMAQEGLDLHASTPESYGTLIKTELERWTRVIKTAGITLE